MRDVVLAPSVEAEMCPRRGTFFSCLAKKTRQKKATPIHHSRNGQGMIVTPKKSGLTKPTATRRVDFKNIPRLHIGLAQVVDLLHPALGPHYAVHAR